ncbi:MAG: hypothetical protein WBB67_01215 [bacterium]
MKTSQKFILIVIGAIISIAGILLLFDIVALLSPQTRLNAMFQKGNRMGSALV